MRGLAAAPAPPRLFHDHPRYRLGRKLGEGGFGVVYEAEDRQQGGKVAIKLLRSAQADWLYRFKREFRALAGLDHPNLVKLHELSVEDGQWFFTMELIDAVRFSEYVGGSPERLRACAAQVARALCVLHASGQIHRDLKPANLLVERGGRAVLLDFGLVLDVRGADSTVLAGTPAYMSPEQGAEQPLGPASDWYSLGLVLFEALTGRLPFAGSTLELLAHKQQHDGPAPSSLTDGVPEDLDELCRALLRADPSARPSGAEIVRRLEPATPSLPAAPVERLVGRDALLEQLAGEYRRADKPRAVLLHGPSGIGKSTLLGGFRSSLERDPRRPVVLQGCCRQRELVPYKALDALIDELARYLRRLPEVEAAGLMPRDAGALAQLFPVLLQSSAVARADVRATIDPTQLRKRGATALRELLARISDRHPLVLVIDDLQWGDADSALLLAELLRPPEAPALLLLGSYRSDEASASPLLRRLGELRAAWELPLVELPVEPLDAVQSRALASALLAETGGDPAQAAQVAAESHGSPFFILELANRRHAGAPADLAAVIAERVTRLPEPAQRLLRVVAVAGRAVEVSVAAAAAQVGDSLRGALTLLGAERLIRGGDRIESYHHRIQETLVAALPADERRRLCLTLAEALEAHGHDDERLAALLLEAGVPARAAVYLTRAAERADQALAFDQAADLFRAALDARAQAGLNDGEERRLRQCLIDVLAKAGRCPELGEACLAAAAAEDADTALALRVRAAGAYLMSCDLERGREILAAVLPPLGLRVPRSIADALFMLVKARLRLKLRGLDFDERDAASLPREELLRLDALWAVVVGFAVIDPLRGGALAAQYLVYALDAGEPVRLLRGLSAEMMTQALLHGSNSKARLEVVLPIARRLAARIDRPEDHASLQFAEGAAALTSARYAEAYQRLGDAETRMRQGASGETLLLTRAASFRLTTMFFMGRSGELGREAETRMEEAEERGNRFAWVWTALFASWARLSQDRAADAEELLERVRRRWPEEPFQVPHYWYHFFKATIGLYQGGDAAWRECDRFWPRLEKSRILRGAAYRIHARWLRARAGLVAAMDVPTRRDELLRQVERDLRSLKDEKMPLADGYAATVAAGLASLRGDFEGMTRQLLVAEPLLENNSLELLRMCARRTRGRTLFGQPGVELEHDSDRWLREQGLVRPDAWVRAHLPTADLPVVVSV